MLERSGELALDGNEPELALERLHDARSLYADDGRTHDAARVAARLSLAFWQLGRTEEAIELGEPAFELLARDEPDADVAMLAAELGRLHNFRGDEKLALARLDFALRYAEDHELPEVLSQALNTKSLVLAERRHESRALLNEALAIALEHDLTAAALRAFNNLVVVSIITDKPDEALRLAREGLELARSRGSRQFAASLGAMTCSSMIFAEETGTEPSRSPTKCCLAVWRWCRASRPASSLAYAAFARGDRELALEHLSRMGAASDSGDLQQRSHALIREILLALVEERPADALGPAREQVDLTLELRIPILSSFSLELACEAAVAAGLQHDLADIVAPLDVVRRRGELAVSRPPSDVHEAGWRPRPATTPRRRRRSRPRWQPHAASATPILGPVLVDYGAWLSASGRLADAELLLAEARGLWEALRAARWLERIDAALTAAAPTR